MTAAPNMAPMTPSASPATGGRFLAALVDDVTRETVRATALQLGWRNPEVLEGGVEALPGLIAGSATPAFLLADISDCADPVAALDAVAAQCESATRVVAVGLANDVALYRRLLAMGVSDYLVKPVSSPVLAEAILAATAARDDIPEAPAQARRAARLISVIGARGGVGVTTLALSAAWQIAQEQRVVLLDLDLHFGSAALSLDLELGRGLHEILANPDRIDSLLIGAAMTKVGERLQLLGAEESLEHDLDGHDGLAALLGEISGTADCVLVDTPRSLNRLSRQVLAAADVIAIVTDLSLPAMRDTRRLLLLAKAQRPRVHTLVIANRVAGAAGEVGRADFERGIGAKIDVVVPLDAKAATTAAERGRTLAEAARNPPTLAALRSLAAAMTGATVATKSSLFERLLGR
ncbi:MAG: pilus assembly protein CpaE [Caulobacteraceae bacterium]|nr:pilus assembly protein CpaE [Caulobacteraceae bacterium]